MNRAPSCPWVLCSHRFESRTKPAKSLSLLNSRATVLLFFRGNRCLPCMVQIRELAVEYRALADRGVQVALSSPQLRKHARSLAGRFGVPFRFLVDAEFYASKALGVFHAGVFPLVSKLSGTSQTRLPTVDLTKAEGVVVDQTDNDRVRPEPSTFFTVLDANR
ncbi:MAG: peroxiredoxin [Polyangiales bacterium]|jgi:peroxiredoxin